MSRTFKTDPFRVQAFRNGHEYHISRDGHHTCDIVSSQKPQKISAWDCCHLTLDWHETAKILSRPRADSQYIRDIEKAKRRKDRQKIRSLSRNVDAWDAMVFEDHRHDAYRMPSW